MIRRLGALILLVAVYLLNIGSTSPWLRARALRQRASSHTRVLGTSLIGAKPPAESP